VAQVHALLRRGRGDRMGIGMRTTPHPMNRTATMPNPVQNAMNAMIGRIMVLSLLGLITLCN
jgi:hypothetical protein